MHLFLAAAAKATVWDKLKAVPHDTWISLLVCLLVIFVLVRLWKNLREFNEFAPWIALFMLGGSVVLYWTYERNEPKLITPVINVLSNYLPSKIPYKDADAPQ